MTLVDRHNALVLEADSEIPKEWSRCEYTHCGDCDVIFARRRQTADEALAYYEHFVRVEDRAYSTTYPPPPAFLESQSAFAKDLWKLVGEELRGVPRDLKVLSIRSECGAILQLLRSELSPAAVDALDYFDNNIRYLKEYVGINNIGKLMPDEVRISFEHDRYGLVLANHSFTHSLDPQETLRVFKDLLEDDGTLLIYNEQDHGKLFRKSWAYGGLLVNSYHKQLFTPNSLIAFLKRNGFSAKFVGYPPPRKWAAPYAGFALIARRSKESLAVADVPAQSTQLLSAYRYWKLVNTPRRMLARSKRWLQSAGPSKTAQK